MLRGIIDWLEERTGIEGHIKHFLYEDVPWSAGWHQVLGSVAMTYLLSKRLSNFARCFLRISLYTFEATCRSARLCRAALTLRLSSWRYDT